MVHSPKQPGSSRRQFLGTTFKSIVAIATAALSYPLLRFTKFRVKPKPRYVVIRKNIPVGSSYTEHDFILFVLENGPVAISRRCTHLGCRVQYRQELDLIECPCHQSRFTVAGVRVAGPATENLGVYPVRVLHDDIGSVNGYEVTV